MLHAASFAFGVEGVDPEGARGGLRDALDEALAKKDGVAVAPMDGGLVAAALGDRGYAGVLLEEGGVREAFVALSEGDADVRNSLGRWQNSSSRLASTSTLH